MASNTLINFRRLNNRNGRKIKQNLAYVDIHDGGYKENVQKIARSLNTTINGSESAADQNSSQTDTNDNNVSTVDSIESINATTGIPGLKYTFLYAPYN